jgi:hypothetical protein
MNAHAERFHRTIQESFVDDHEEWLFTDLALFNRKLADWLVFYNASASAPHRRPAFPAILPLAISTRVPKVLDSYKALLRHLKLLCFEDDDVGASPHLKNAINQEDKAHVQVASHHRCRTLADHLSSSCARRLYHRRNQVQGRRPRGTLHLESMDTDGHGLPSKRGQRLHSGRL